MGAEEKEHSIWLVLRASRGRKLGSGAPHRLATCARLISLLLFPFSACLQSSLCPHKAVQASQETSFEKMEMKNPVSLPSDTTHVCSCGQPCAVLGLALVSGVERLFQRLPSWSFWENKSPK